MKFSLILPVAALLAATSEAWHFQAANNTVSGSGLVNCTRLATPVKARTFVTGEMGRKLSAWFYKDVNCSRFLSAGVLRGDDMNEAMLGRDALAYMVKKSLK